MFVESRLDTGGTFFPAADVFSALWTFNERHVVCCNVITTLFLSSMSRVHHYFGRRCHFEGLELMVYREQCMTSAPLEPSHTALKHPFIAPHLLISVSICVTLWPIHGYTESGCSRRKLARCKD